MSERIKSMKLVKFYTTPAELRDLAFRLEAKWLECKLGDRMPEEAIYDTETELRFIVDLNDINSPVKSAELLRRTAELQEIYHALAFLKERAVAETEFHKVAELRDMIDRVTGIIKKYEDLEKEKLLVLGDKRIREMLRQP